MAQNSLLDHTTDRSSLTDPLEVPYPIPPQSSGGGTDEQDTQETLTKLTLKIHLDWTKLLPIALTQVQPCQGSPSS